MIRVHVTPAAVHDELAGNDAMQRLAHGDALDQAMYGWSLLTTVIADARARGATSLTLDVEGAGDIHAAMAETNHMTLVRELCRMHRDLPAPPPRPLTVRPFEVGRDETAWLEVNNRAFAWHPEQGGWDLAALQAREAEPWFDPAGFFLHEIGDRLAGFCWTKVHRDERPQLGEIFVIAVDPDLAGRGLGRDLVLIGLDWLAHQDLHHAILYVEGDNESALALYHHLGFEVTETRRWWRLDLTTPAPGSPPDGLTG